MNEVTAPRGIVPFDREAISLAADLARTFASSGFFSDARDAGKALVKIIAGAEIGMSPFQAMSGLHVIEGKVELSANLMARMVKASPKYDYRVRENTTEECSIEFFEIVDGKSEPIGTSTYTMAQAKTAGISHGRSGLKANWKAFPAAMLFARALSQGVRMFCPDAVSQGAPVYVTGEISGREVDLDGNPLVQVVETNGSAASPADQLAAKLERNGAATEQPSPGEATGSSSGDSSDDEDHVGAIRILEQECSPDAHDAACAALGVTGTSTLESWSPSSQAKFLAALREAISAEAGSSGPEE